MFPILTGLWVYYIMCTDYPAAGAMAQQILAVARQLNDTNGTVLGRWVSCGTAYFQGQLRTALEHAEAGWTAYDPHNYEEMASLFGHNPGPGCADWGASACWHLGYRDRARKWGQQAIDAATRVMHPPTISTVLVHAAMYGRDWQDPQEALKQAESAIALSEQTGIPLRKVEADIAKGWALSVLGDPARGIPVLESGLKGWNLMGSRIADTCWYTMLGEAYRAAGRQQEASDALARARQELRNSGERVYEPQLCHEEGLLCLDASDTEGAEVCFQNGLRAARDIEARSMELRVAIDLARLWQSKGKGKEARELLAPIYSWFTEGFDTKDLMRAKVLLEELW